MRDLLSQYGGSGPDFSGRCDKASKFVLAQMDRMPWLPRFAIVALTLLFGLSSFVHRMFSFFRSSPQESRKTQLDVWSRSSFRPFRDFVKFYAAMSVLSFYSDENPSANEASR